jgi:hypothetical protein
MRPTVQKTRLQPPTDAQMSDLTGNRPDDDSMKVAPHVQTTPEFVSWWRPDDRSEDYDPRTLCR